MKIQRQVLMLLMIAVFSGCSDDANPVSDNNDGKELTLVPFAVGNTWVYYDVSTIGNTDFDTLRIVDKTVLRIDDEDKSIFRFTGTHPVTEFQWYCDSWGIHSYAPGFTIGQFKYPSDQGENYVSSANGITYSITVVDTDATVVTNIRSYDGCYVYEMNDSQGNKQIQSVKPGVGVVKGVMYPFFGGVATTELVEYNLVN